MSNSHEGSKTERRPYIRPEITRVTLEDRRVVAMDVCKTGMSDEACIDRIAGLGPVQGFNFASS